MSNVLKNAGYNTEEIYFHKENQRLIEEARKNNGEPQKTTNDHSNVIPISRAKKFKAAAAMPRKKAA